MKREKNKDMSLGFWKRTSKTLKSSHFWMCLSCLSRICLEVCTHTATKHNHHHVDDDDSDDDFDERPNNTDGDDDEVPERQNGVVFGNLLPLFEERKR